MAETREVPCEDCGIVVRTKRINTKVCKVCRLIRDLKFVTNRSAKCWDCNRAFSPLNSQQRFCGYCDSPHKVELEGVCGLCHRAEHNLIHPDVSVCRVCAVDPNQREQFYRALKKKQSQRKAQADLEAAA